MTKAFRIHQPGGPEAMIWEDVTLPAPAPHEVLIRHTAVGVNFIDVYFRTGLYPTPLPSGIGLEGAGVVEAVGDAVTDLKVGQRVAYAGGPPGSYAEARLIPADRLVPIPDGITDAQAAAMMLKGMTAQYLLRQTCVVKPGDAILIHAAAGGVGQLVCQWAKHLGATVIGTVGSPEKAKIAQSLGCDHAILYKIEDFVARVRELTDGKGVRVVYDSVGQTTFMGSLDCLQPLGMMVSFGQSSGKVPPLDIGLLSAKGSLFLTRPTLFTYVAKREALLATANELFEMVLSKVITITVAKTYPLADAPQAHRDLEGRESTGASILLP